MKNEWRKIKLGDVAEFRNGINYSKKNFGKGIKVINVRNFKDWSFTSYDDLDEINPLGIIRDDDLLKEGDIIFVRSNGNRELIGRSMFVKNIDDQITHSAFSIKTRFISKDIEPRYFAYVFRTPIIRKTLSAHGGGTNINNLNQEILSRLEIDLPDLSIQRRITSILSAYDDLIENNTRRIKILEEMARLIYREWFVEFKAPDIKLRKATPEEKKVTGKDVFPEEWEISNLGEVIQIHKGKKVKNVYESQVEESVPYLLLDGIESGKYLFTDKNEKTVANENDVLMVMDGARSGLVFIGLNGIVGSTLASFRTTELQRYHPYLLFNFLQSNFDNIAHKNVGAAIPHANKDFIVRMDIVLPTIELNKKASEIFENIFCLIRLLKNKNTNLRQTRDLLLPKLISGEVEVY